tara:strand:- start:1538 stop:2809 length:1272 start_codon:yes stop_codon:yes gene_type:complete
MAISKRNNQILIIIYLSIILGFFLSEDTLGGAYSDYETLNHIAYKFKNNFWITLLNYDELNHRQSPVFYIFKSLFLNLNENIQRLLFLHIFLLIPLFFYKCLKIVFKNIDKKILKLISLLIILLPTFRSYSIWPDPHLMGTLFFLISIFYFLKFKNNPKDYIYVLLNTLFLALSAYFSPNFGLFVIFFIYQFYKNLGFSLRLNYIFLLNIFLSLPFFYYIFILDINFIFSNTHWDIGKNFYSLNSISNKFIIITSLIFFYLIPFIFLLKININYNFFIKNKIYYIFYLIIFLIFCYFFKFSDVYDLTNSGGGFFFNISKTVFDNNLLLFIVSFFAGLYLIQTFILNKENLILFLVLILSNPQLTIWQANFSPTLFIMIYLLFDLNFITKKLDIKFIKFQYFYFLGYLVANYIYKYDISKSVFF